MANTTEHETPSSRPVLARGSRRWLEFAEPAVWQLAHDRALGLQVLAARAHHAGRRFTVESLRRTVYECAGCTAREVDGEIEHYAGCAGGDVVAVQGAAPKVALGLLDGTRAGLARMGLGAA